MSSPSQRRSSRPRRRGQRTPRDARMVRVVAVRRQPPDLDRFVAALIALATAELQAQEAQAREGARPRSTATQPGEDAP